MSIDKAFDARVRAARYKLRDTQSAYKAAIREKNELVVLLNETEGWDVYTLMAQFQMKKDAIDKLLSDAKPVTPNTRTTQSSASNEARGYIK